jgi:hypothetical protein
MQRLGLDESPKRHHAKDHTQDVDDVVPIPLNIAGAAAR